MFWKTSLNKKYCLIYTTCEKKKVGIESTEESMNPQFKIILNKSVYRAKNLHNVILIEVP